MSPQLYMQPPSGVTCQRANWLGPHAHLVAPEATILLSKRRKTFPPPTGPRVLSAADCSRRRCLARGLCGRMGSAGIPRGCCNVSLRDGVRDHG
jgi:hypothetical protein